MLRDDDDNPDDSPAGDDCDALDLSMPGSEVEDVFSRMVPNDAAEIRAMVGRLFGTTRGAAEVGLHLCNAINDGNRKLMLLALNEVARSFLVSDDPLLVAWGAELTDKLVQTAQLAIMLDTAREQAAYICDARDCTVQAELWNELVPRGLQRNVIELYSIAHDRSTKG